MYKSRFIAPFTVINGMRKSNISFAKKRSGVYIIAKEKEIVYVGFSATDVERTALRHFQEWNDKKQVRTHYRYLSGITIRIVLTTANRAAMLEKALIVKLRPKDNPDKLQHILKLSETEKQIIVDFNETPVSTIQEINDCPF